MLTTFNMYDVEDRVLNYFNEYLRKIGRQEVTKNIARKKFSTIVNYAARRRHDETTNVTRYRYGRFMLMVDENTKNIFYIDIVEDEERVQRFKQETPNYIHIAIKKAYKELGLTKTGYAYKKSEYSLV